MTDYRQKALDQATETSKLLITLSTAVVAFCAAVVNVKVGETTLLVPTTCWERWLLAFSWIGLLVCTAVGVWTQLAVTDVLGSGTKDSPPSAWSGKVIVPFQIQIVSFGIGMLVLVVYGILRLKLFG
jgi:hypothetical protein